MIEPNYATQMLTSQPPKVRDDLIDNLPVEDVRVLLKVAVRLLWGEEPNQTGG